MVRLIEAWDFPKARPDDFIGELEHLRSVWENPATVSPIDLSQGLAVMDVILAAFESSLRGVRTCQGQELKLSVQRLQSFGDNPGARRSRGFPGENIAQVAGKPLISYTTELTQDLPWLDSTVVSTDSQEIAETATQTPTVAAQCGARRSSRVTGNGDHPVLRHALIAPGGTNVANRFGDIVLMLQPALSRCQAQ